MNITSRFQIIIKVFAFIAVSAALNACGGSGGGSEVVSAEGNDSDSIEESGSVTGQIEELIVDPVEDPSVDLCTQEFVGINWDALLTENCLKLSDYNLFSNAADPTSGPNENGIPYDLSTPLFTDYATKYRFVFVPEGKVATYSKDEVIEFPVGTVLVKTFSMPENTNNRGVNETHIETRLLIHREKGWTAIPYYWDSATDASYMVVGKTIAINITHDGESLAFDYGVPQKNQCTNCHAVVPVLGGPEDKRKSIFKPIGPKARFLNYDYNYGSQIENQLAHWESSGILVAAPADKTSIDSAPIVKDTMDIVALSEDTVKLNTAARAYLDINCAHCHRNALTISEPNYAGAAGDSGLTVEFNRDFGTDPGKFGVCKTAVAGGYPAEVAGGYNQYPRDIVPQHADRSYLLYRMNTNDGRHKMPELGRGSIHKEGVELIRAWINSLPENDCGLTDLVR
jgi:uncharacterized repeat protein (TIGR03806 family)